jgi:short-subunit dehydrogenase
VTDLWAMVTGASVGLGRQFALQLAERGYSVVLVARGEQALRAVASDIQDRWDVSCEVLVADLLDETDRERVRHRLVSEDTPIDVLVNNAGWGLSDDFHQSTWGDEKDHHDIHVSIPLQLTHSVIPAMRARGRGRVIVVSSVAAFLARGPYSAAKRYWVTMARSLTAAYRKDSVTVTALCPGFTRTEFHERMGMDVSGVPRWAWLSADRVVREGLRDAFRGKAVSVPSLRYRILVALAPLIPARFHRMDNN